MKSGLSLRAVAVRTGLIAALGLGCATLISAKPALAGEEMLRTLTVSGQGVESVATTITQVQLGVEVQGKTAVEVQQEAARRSQAVVTFLRSRNVNKLQTTGISLNPVYNYSNNEQRIIGYSATNTVSFEVETAKAGNILDEAVRSGATRISGVSFVASDEALRQAQQVALREATQLAQEQANTVLSALGLSSKEVVGVQINAAPPIIRPPMPMAAMARQDAAASPVVGGEQEVQASVTLQIRY